MKVSKTGYKKNSKDKNEPSLLIPSNRITMKNVEFPVYGVDDTGYSQMMYPGLDYSFPGSYVYELPMAKGGGHIVPGRYRNPEGNWLNKYQDAGEVTPGMMSSGQKRSDYVPYKDVSGSPYEIQDPYIGNYSTVDIPENLSELPSYRLYTMAKGSPKPFSPDWNTGLNLNDQGYLKFDEKTGYNYQPSKQNLQDFQSLPMEGEKEFNLRRFVLNPYEGQPQTHDAYVKKDGTVDKENFIPTSYSREETMDNVFKDLYAQNLYKFKGDRDAAYTATSEFMKERVEPQYKGKYYDYMNNPNVSADDKLNINLKGSHMTVNPQQTEDYVRQQITNKIIEEHPEYMEQDEAGNYKISDDDLSDLVKADPRYKEKLNEYNDVLQDWYVTNKNMSPEEAKALVEKDLYKNVPKRKTTYATFKNGGWLEKYQDGSEVAANLPWINSQGQYQEPVKTSKALSDDDLRRIDISETSETTDTPAVRLAQQVAVQQHEDWQNRKPIAKKPVSKKQNYNARIAEYSRAEDKKVIDTYYKKYDPANEEQVKAIQAELVAKNFLSGPAAIDGKFGDKTKQAYLKYKTAERVGDLSGETKKSTCSYDGCAEYVSSVTRPYGWVLGDAWTMKNNIETNGGTVKYNIYTDPRFSRVKSKDQLKNVTEAVKRNNKASADMFEVGDVVGLYYKGSNMHQTALKDGRGTYNTHVGVVTEIKDGKPIISHNIHGKLHHDPYDNLTIGWVGTPAPRMAQYKPSKQPETLKDKINIYSKELTEILAPGVDSEKIANNIKGILRKETGLGRLTPTEADIKEIQAKRFLLGESTDPKDISRGIGKLKTATIPDDMKYFLGINDENVDDDAGVKAAVYKYVDAYNQLKKYSQNNPQLNLTDEDLHQMSILAYNQGTDKLLNLGYNNPSMPISSEVDALRDLYSGNVKDISSTNFKYLPSINTTIAGIPINIDPGQALYDYRYPEGHESYFSRVNKYANTPIEELEASMANKKLGGWLDQYQDGGLIETTRKLNKKYPGYSIWFDKENIFIRKPSQNASWERLPSDIEFIKSKDGNLETSELMPIRPALMPPSNTMKVLTSIQEEDRAKQKPKVVKAPDFKEGGWLNKYQGDTQSSQVERRDPNQPFFPSSTEVDTYESQYSLPEVTIAPNWTEAELERNRLRDKYIADDKKAFRHWYDKLGYDKDNVTKRANQFAYNKLAKEYLKGDKSKLTPEQKKFIEKSEYASRLQPSIASRFVKGVTNPSLDMTTVSNVLAPFEYPGNLVRGAVQGEFVDALMGQTPSPYFVSSDLAGTSPSEAALSSSFLTLGTDPLFLTGDDIFRGIGQGAKAIARTDAAQDAAKFLTTQTPLQYTYKLNPKAKGSLFKPWGKNMGYRVVNEEGYKDALKNFLVRSNPKGDNTIFSRPTGFPSFAKGKPSKNFLKTDNTPHYIMETDVPLYARGEVNPVTGMPIKSSHGAARPIDPITGETLSSMPIEDINNIYKAQPNWLQGYERVWQSPKGIQDASSLRLGENIATSGFFNRGVYELPDYPGYLLKYEDKDRVRDLALPDIDNLDFADIQRNINSPNVGKVIKHLKNQTNPLDEFSESINMDAYVMRRMPGKPFGTMTLDELKRIPENAFIQYAKDYDNLIQQKTAVDNAGLNMLYSPEEQAFKFIDLSPEANSNTNPFWRDNVIKGVNSQMPLEERLKAIKKIILEQVDNNINANVEKSARTLPYDATLEDADRLRTELELSGQAKKNKIKRELEAAGYKKYGGWLDKYQGKTRGSQTVLMLPNTTPPANLPWINQQGQFTQVPPVQPKDFEARVDDYLGNPMQKGRDFASWLSGPGEDPHDAGRHTATAANASHTIKEKTGSSLAGFVGANMLGAAHEIYKLPQTIKSDGLYHGLIGTAEDFINNAVGAAVGVFPSLSIEGKESFLVYLTDNNMLPDGVSMPKGDMYWKKKKGGEKSPSLGYYEYIGGYRGASV